jgi:hypothetical protein
VGEARSDGRRRAHRLERKGPPLNFLPRKHRDLWILTAVTYGIVIVLTLAAAIGYYSMRRGPSEEDKSANMAIGSVWIPVYPNAVFVGHTSSSSGDATENTYRLESKDSAAQVLTFYETKLKGGRFWVNRASRDETGGSVQASANGHRAQLFITVRTTPQGSEGVITSVERPPDK